MITGSRHKTLLFYRSQSSFHGIGADQTEPPRNAVDGVVVRMVAQATQHTAKELGTRRRHEWQP